MDASLLSETTAITYVGAVNAGVRNVPFGEVSPRLPIAMNKSWLLRAKSSN